MDSHYQQGLRRIAERLPSGPCVVALAAAGEIARAAAMAGDLAAEVAGRRAGHTILFSLESAPRALDHELGVESDLGLSDALAGRATVRDIAVRSGARGFIYVPAGTSPFPALRVLTSPAWRKIAASALERGAALLVFLEAGALTPESAGAVEGAVLLGGAEEDPDAGGAPILGRLRAPRLTPPASAVAAPTPEAFHPVLEDSRARVSRRRHGMPESRAFGIMVIVAVLLALVVLAVAVVASAGMEPGHAGGLPDLPGLSDSP